MIGLIVFCALISAFYLGRAVQTMGAPLLLAPESPPRALPPPYRGESLPTTAPEAVLLVRHLREGVDHARSVLDAAMAELDELEREAQEFATRLGTT